MEVLSAGAEATMATQLRTMTAEELLAMPEDGIRRELVEGELREMSPAGEEHARVVQNVNRSRDADVHANRLGRVATCSRANRIRYGLRISRSSGPSD
jgi:hypothetical protein